MKQEQRQVTIYVAEDGTEFTSETDCIQYELVGGRVLAKLSRREAWAFALKQLDGDTPQVNKSPWHYGKCEIQQLLDAIYGFNSKGEIV